MLSPPGGFGHWTRLARGEKLHWRGCMRCWCVSHAVKRPGGARGCGSPGDLAYLWNAGHRELADRLGNMLVCMHASAPHPLSTELFEISDSIRAIGSYRPGDGAARST